MSLARTNPVESSRALLAKHVVVLMLVQFTAWPLPTRITQVISQGSELAPTVPLLNLWTIGRQADRPRSGWENFWDGGAFHPCTGSLALSEPLISSEIFAPIVWGTGTPILAYNLFLMLLLWLNGAVTLSILTARRLPWPVALLGACLIIRLPFVMRNLGVIQLVGVAGILGTLHCVIQGITSGSRRHFALTGAAIGLTYLTCAYFGLFLILLIPFAVVLSGIAEFIDARRVKNLPKNSIQIREELSSSDPRSSLLRGEEEASPRRNDERRGISRSCSATGSMQLLPSVRWSGVALGIGIAALMIAPVAIGQQRHLGQPEFERPRELVRELSAKPGDYLQTPFPEIWEFIGWRRERDPSRWSLSPGLWKSGLALAAIGLLWRRPRRRQGWAVCWLGIGLVAAIASFGLHWEIGGCSPYGFLMDWVPGLSRVRVPARFAVVVQIAVVLLSLEFIHEFHRRGRIDWRRAVRAKRPLLKLPLVATWLTALVACFEISQPPMQFVEIPDAQTQQGWLRWLRQTPTDAVIAHVPFPTGTYPSDYQRETWAMYWSLFHQRRIVNGYSGFFPKSYLTLKARMQSFPDSDSLAALRAAGVSYCVIGQAEVEAKQLEADRRFVESFNLAYHDREAGVLIYRWREARTGVDSEP